VICPVAFKLLVRRFAVIILGLSDQINTRSLEDRMRIVCLTSLALAISATSAIAAPMGPTDGPSRTPVAVYPPATNVKMTAKGERELLAQRAARMINGGHCKGALRMALRERDFLMADRIQDSCRTISGL
jgi:hypothetical protein